jgi:uncharacterized protein Yka (UPF0111/DUF47 family)
MPSPRPPKRPLAGFQKVLAAFMPKEEDFFQLFREMSDYAVQAAEALQELSDDFGRLDWAVKKLDEVEHASDDIVHQIVGRLNTTFVTPLMMDREDIYRLAERVDDITDHLKGVVDRFRTYEVTEPTPYCRRMASLLYQAASLLRDNMYALESLKPGANPFCASINDLENQGDALLKEALGALFRESADARDIIKWKDIYEMMEEGLDQCEDAANLVEAVVVKNA